MWQSGDPLLQSYIPTGREKRENLASLGGIYNSVNIGLYAYSHQNPIIMRDPDGLRVVSMNPKNNRKILQYLHKYTGAEFKFNKNNELQLVNKNRSTGSSYYTNKLIQVINDKATPLFVDIKQTMTQYPAGFDKKTGKFKWVSPRVWYGVSGPQNVDKRHGGGFTAGAKGSAVLLVISGNELPTVNADGAAGIAKPEDVLMHEFLGHAAPNILASDTGNAIKNENKARQELKLKLRKVDPGHTE